MPGTSEFFHSYAHDFDAIYGNKNTPLNALVNKHLRKSMRLRYEKTLEGCDPIEGKTVIDIGCGPGHYSVALAARGATSVFGLDFARGMIDLAEANARQSGVQDRCRFVIGDFMTWPFEEKYDYAVVMGFMDYVAEPRRCIERVVSLTRGKAFFSFPVEGGVLAWQRKLRYKSRCDLFMYTRSQLDELFRGLPARNVQIEQIARDYFVTVTVG